MELENGMYIRPLQLLDAESMLELRLRNRRFLEPFEPIQKESHFTLHAQEEILRQAEENWRTDLAYGFGIFLNENDTLIGRVNLSNVVRGAWQNCTIGYFLDEACNGRGYMTDAVKLACEYAFETAELHRVQAAVMPRNLPSIRVVEKTGFNYDGYAKYYLKINGKWEDHKLYSITQEDWTSSG
jgi:[ribosomal protein S5]-alanine N-acetyltransferase